LTGTAQYIFSLKEIEQNKYSAQYDIFCSMDERKPYSFGVAFSFLGPKFQIKQTMICYTQLLLNKGHNNTILVLL